MTVVSKQSSVLCEVVSPISNDHGQLTNLKNTVVFWWWFALLRSLAHPCNDVWEGRLGVGGERENGSCI